MVVLKKNKGGAPKGNQNALGHGRPSNSGYTDRELIALGKELFSWMEKMDLENKEIVHLSEWYSKIKKIPRSQWNSITQRGCFLEYYEQALEWIGRRILLNKTLPTAYGSRFLGIYFKEIREYEKKIIEEKIDYELAKKASIEQLKGIPPNDAILTELLNSLRRDRTL